MTDLVAFWGSHPAVPSTPTAIAPTHPLSPTVRDVLSRMHLSPSEQRLLILLAQASTVPLADATLLDALEVSWHVKQLQARMQDLRSKLSLHGLVLLRVLNYGYLLLWIEPPHDDASHGIPERRHA